MDVVEHAPARVHEPLIPDSLPLLHAYLADAFLVQDHIEEHSSTDIASMVIPQLLDGRSRAKLFPEDLRIFLSGQIPKLIADLLLHGS